MQKLQHSHIVSCSR